MIILTGSTNKAKLDAVKQAFSKLGKAFFINPPAFRIIAIPTKTTVPDMPLTLAEIKDGARQRAEYILSHFETNGQRHIALGMEGGVYREENQTFLQNWVFATDGDRSYFGASALITLPPSISYELFEKKRELAEVIDAYSGQIDVRSNKGAFGILSRNLITRRAAFESAVISAVVPLLEPDAYRSV